jgi:hypothetical protein
LGYGLCFKIKLGPNMFDIIQRQKFGISKQLRDKLTIHLCDVHPVCRVQHLQMLNSIFRTFIRQHLEGSNLEQEGALNALAVACSARPRNCRR